MSNGNERRRTILDAFTRIWAERRLYLLTTGRKIFVSLADPTGSSIYIYFSDAKIMQVGNLLTEEERNLIVREWPAGVKTLRLDIPAETQNEPVTRSELRKVLEEIERKIEARSTDNRLEAARERSEFFREQKEANRELISTIMSQLQDTMRLHILNIATIRDQERESSGRPSIKSVETIRDGENERACDEIRRNVAEVIKRQEEMEKELTQQNWDNKNNNPYASGPSNGHRVQSEEDLANRQSVEAARPAREAPVNSLVAGGNRSPPLFTRRRPNLSRDPPMREGRQGGDRNRERPRCFTCGANGHLSAQCPNPDKILSRDCRGKRPTESEPQPSTSGMSNAKKRKGFSKQSNEKRGPVKQNPSSFVVEEKGEKSPGGSEGEWSDVEPEPKNE